MRHIYRVHPPQITRACDWCDKLFQPLMRDVMEGRGRFCSRSCSNNCLEKEYREGLRPSRTYPKSREKTGPRVTLICSFCTKSFERLVSGTTESKSKLYFCSKLCKSNGQRLESNIVEVHPSHYKNGETSYREIAFRYHPKKCNRCGYCKIPEILEVHHKDRNRQNNYSTNLEVLCSTCHNEEHFLAKDGRYERNHLNKPFVYSWKNNDPPFNTKIGAEDGI